eukprot:jgi/Mesen1/7478/ME000039S06689
MGFLVPLASHGQRDESQLVLSVEPGVQTLGRDDLKVEVKNVSRVHLQLESTSGDPWVKLTVLGQNCAVKITPCQDRLTLRPGESTTLVPGDVVEWLPGKFPFKYVLSETETATERGLAKRCLSPPLSSASLQQTEGQMGQGPGRQNQEASDVVGGEARIIQQPGIGGGHSHSRSSSATKTSLLLEEDKSAYCDEATYVETMGEGEGKADSSHERKRHRDKEEKDPKAELLGEQELREATWEVEEDAWREAKRKKQEADDEAFARLLQEEEDAAAMGAAVRHHLEQAAPPASARARHRAAHLVPSSPASNGGKGGQEEHEQAPSNNLLNQDAGQEGPALQSEQDPPLARSEAEDGGSCCPSASFKLLRTDGVPTRANEGSIGLCDILQGDMEWVIFSDYMVDLPWLLSACPALASVPHVALLHGERGASLQSLLRQKPATWRLHSPPLRIAYGTHHSKAILVGYATGVRVAVHTANLLHIDFHNKTQGLWLQDFPLKPTRKGSSSISSSSPRHPADFHGPPDPRARARGPGNVRAGASGAAETAVGGEGESSSAFEDDLVEYLAALEWPGCDVTRPSDGSTFRLNARHFRCYDFSDAAVRLVASVPGYHSGAALHKWGHMKLRAILSQERNFSARFVGSPLVFQFSSLGSIDERWLAELASSLSAGSTGCGRQPLGPASGVRCVWPTVEDVRNSLEGYGAGGSICGPAKNVDRPVVRSRWARWHAESSGRSRAMPHIKTFLRHSGTNLAWVLLTSSNLSKAAWGALQKGGAQLMVRSYELGVLFLPTLTTRHMARRAHFSCTARPAGPPPSEVEPLGGAASGSSDGAAAVEFVQRVWGRDSLGDTADLALSPPQRPTLVSFAVPYALPPPSYGPSDTPWAWDRQYPEPDVYGQVWPRAISKHSSANDV